jgi:hypothetical protein
MRKFLRTIRFDDSDTRVYGLAANAGEWAVSGAFEFGALDPAELRGKARQGFANGFLGLISFGRSTFATVGEARDADLAQIERRLAEHLVARYGAPSLEAAFPAAGEEMAFVLDLCEGVPINTVFTMRRFHDDRGRIKEELRTVSPPAGGQSHARIWSVERDPQ